MTIPAPVSPDRVLRTWHQAGKASCRELALDDDATPDLADDSLFQIMCWGFSKPLMK